MKIGCVKGILTTCLFIITVSWARAVPPVVSNVHAAQRPGTKLVDITYDLADSDSNSLTVGVEISGDGGQTFAIPAATLSGDVGPDISPGLGRAIVWNAGSDWAGHYVPGAQVRVTADDSSPPPNFPAQAVLSRPDLTALTGGGAGALDGIATVSVNPPLLVALRLNGQLTVWQLDQGNATADVSAGIVRPLDFDAMTNAKVWTRLAVGVSTVAGLQSALDAKADVATTAALAVSTASLSASTTSLSASAVRSRLFGAVLKPTQGPLIPLVATPPAITRSGTTVPSLNGALVPWNSPAFAYGGGDTYVGSASVYPDTLFGVSRFGTNGPANGSSDVEFLYDGAAFEIWVKEFAGTGFLVYVDGALATAALTWTRDVPGGGAYYKVDLGTAALHRIRLEMNGQFYFGGIVPSDPNHSVYPDASARRPRCIVMGDSYTQGSSATDYLRGFPRVLGKIFNWDVWASGVGGSGYLVGGQGGSTATIRGRLATDLYPFAPDIVILAAGHNDTASTADQIQAEVGLVLDGIAANLPTAKIYVVGPMFEAGPAPPQIIAVRDGIKAACAARGVPHIDPVLAGSEWITGSSAAGTGNAAIYISGDNVHPNTDGHEYLARRIAAQILSLEGF